MHIRSPFRGNYDDAIIVCLCDLFFRSTQFDQPLRTIVRIHHPRWLIRIMYKSVMRFHVADYYYWFAQNTIQKKFLSTFSVLYSPFQMVNQNRKITGTDLCFVLIEIDLRMIWIYSHVCLRYYVFFFVLKFNNRHFSTVDFTFYEKNVTRAFLCVYILVRFFILTKAASWRFGHI